MAFNWLWFLKVCGEGILFEYMCVDVFLNQIPPPECLCCCGRAHPCLQQLLLQAADTEGQRQWRRHQWLVSSAGIKWTKPNFSVETFINFVCNGLPMCCFQEIATALQARVWQLQNLSSSCVLSTAKLSARYQNGNDITNVNSITVLIIVLHINLNMLLSIFLLLSQYNIHMCSRLLWLY